MFGWAGLWVVVIWAEARLRLRVWLVSVEVREVHVPLGGVILHGASAPAAWAAHVRLQERLLLADREDGDELRVGGVLVVDGLEGLLELRRLELRTS